MRCFSSSFAVLILALTGWSDELRQTVMAGSKYSYADLLRKVFPNLKVNKAEPEAATASKSVSIRPVNRDEKPFECTSDVKISDVRRIDLHAVGQRQVVLMFTLDHDDGTVGASDLALFDVSGNPKLLDIVEAPSFPDDHGWLTSDSGPLHINEATDAFVMYTQHHNSSESYENYTPIFVDNGKFKTIDSFDLLSCNDYNDAFQERIAFSTAPDPERRYNKVLARVTVEVLPDPPDQKPRRRTKKSVRSYTAEYRWDTAKGEYAPASTQLPRLAEFNGKNR
jgi:hypothetical protein